VGAYPRPVVIPLLANTGATTVNTDNTDPNKQPPEVPPKDAKTELTEEELAKVSGGKLYEATTHGSHFTQATLTTDGGTPPKSP
jgi:bacteriocin-like protein